MNGGDWSALDLREDPVRGDPGAVRALGNASQQEARRWEEQVQALRTIAGEGNAMEMVGDFAPVARERLQTHPNDATPLARGRTDAGAALLAYAGQLDQAKRASQAALQQGTQAKRDRDTAERNLKQVQARIKQVKMQLQQVQAQMRAMSGQTYAAGPAFAAAMQRFNMLRAQEAQLLAQEGQLLAQERQYLNAWETAEAKRVQARQQALAAGERATQQERVAAESVGAATQKVSAAGQAQRGTGSRASL